MRYDIERLKNACPELKQIVCLKICSSTNQIARDIAEDEDADRVLVLTELQTDGRGRLGRSWVYSDGGIAMSLMFRPELKNDTLPMMTLIAALAVHDAILELTGLETQIKWPNDIYCSGRKICGILTEGVLNGSSSFAVLGIGLNLNQTGLPEEISTTALSVKMISGKDTCPEDMISSIITGFFAYLTKLANDGNMSALKDIYNRYCIPGNEIDENGQQVLHSGI